MDPMGWPVAVLCVLLLLLSSRGESRPPAATRCSWLGLVGGGCGPGFEGPAPSGRDLVILASGLRLLPGLAFLFCGLDPPHLPEFTEGTPRGAVESEPAHGRRVAVCTQSCTYQVRRGHWGASVWTLSPALLLLLCDSGQILCLSVLSFPPL